MTRSIAQNLFYREDKHTLCETMDFQGMHFKEITVAVLFIHTEI